MSGSHVRGSEVTIDAAISSTGDVLVDQHVNVFADEANRAIAHHRLDATGMPAEWFVIRTAVVIDPAALRRATQRSGVGIRAGDSGSRRQGIAGA